MMDDRARASLSASVIICTRDRGAALLPTVESILADAPADGSVELLVVDQSDGDSVRQALAAITDPRVRYFAEASRGLSAARNAGIRASRADVIACTDDDCVVEAGWLTAILATFAAHPEAGVVFGHVACAEHDASQGYLPGFRAQEGFLTGRRMLAGAGHWGMGANMALRRSAIERIGPFDERLGAGAELKSAEDVDYALRARQRHIGVYHTAAARVVHHGFRPWAQASALMRGASSGIGAMYAKHVRAGHGFALVLWLSDLRGRSFDVARNAVRLRRPLGANALIYQVSGFSRGWRMPVVRPATATGLVFS